MRLIELLTVGAVLASFFSCGGGAASLTTPEPTIGQPDPSAEDPEPSIVEPEIEVISTASCTKTRSTPV